MKTRWGWIAMLLGLLTAVVDGATIKVDPNGGGEFLLLQQAINSASVGDVVLVGPGTYDEPIIIDKGIKVIGIDPMVCKIVYTGSGSAVTFKGGTQGAQILRLSITSLGGDGILCEAGSVSVIKNNVITGTGGDGIEAKSGATVSILNNTIGDNRQIGIYSYDPATIVNNIINSNGEGGIRWRTNHSSSEFPINYNDVWGNIGSGYRREISSSDPPSSDIAQNPQFVNATAGDYRLQPTSPCINAGWDNSVYADPDGSRNDIGAYGGPDAPSPGPMVVEIEVQPQSVPQGQPLIIRATGVAR